MKKKILISSILSIIMCISLIVGATFALFESESKVNIAVTSGKVNVTAVIDTGSVKTKQLNQDYAIGEGNLYRGEVDFTEEGLTLVKFLPGDGITFNIIVTNNSDVTVKYRTIISCSSDNGLYSGLNVDIAGKENFNGNRFVALWETMGQGSYTVPVVIELPETAGNEYQEKSCTITYFVEVVQGNATTTNLSDEVVVGGNVEPVVLKSNSETTPVVEVPADLLNDLAANSVASKISLEHSDPVIKNDSVIFEKMEIVDENGEIIDLEQLNNDKPISVKVDVSDAFNAGENVSIYHNGEYVTMVTVANDGTISYEATHFCEVVVSKEFKGDVHYIDSAEEFIEVLTAIKTEGKIQIPGATGNKAYRENAVFVLENDIVIDKDTEFMYTDGNGAPLHFYGVRGVLDFNGHNITVTSDALINNKAYANAVLLIQYSNLDIIGEGSIIANNKSIPVYAWANSTVNVYSGTYVTNAWERNESAVYVNNASVSLHVYGGNFENNEYAFNVHDTSCAGATVMVLHEGITYADYLKNGTVDVIASDLNGNRIAIAGDCELVKYEENNKTMNKIVKK